MDQGGVHVVVSEVTSTHTVIVRALSALRSCEKLVTVQNKEPVFGGDVKQCAVIL